MLGRMGSQQSSVSCRQLSYGLNNCFGMGSASPSSTGSKRSSVIPLANGSAATGKDFPETQVEQVLRGKRRSQRRSCSKKSDDDMFTYNLCSVSHDQVNAETSLKSTHNGISNGQTPMSCAYSKIKQSSKYQDISSSVDSNCLPGAKTTTHSNNNRMDCTSDLNHTKSIQEPANENSSNTGETFPTSKILSLPDKSEVHELPAKDSSDSQDITYFRKLVADEEFKLTDLIKLWSNLISSENHCPSEVCDEIRSVVGQTHLIIDERFSQFSKLIDQADDKSLSTRPVLVSDLQGFWDMIYFQVNDVVQKFASLQKLKDNNWTVAKDESAQSNSNNSQAYNETTRQLPRSRPKKNKMQLKSKEEDKKRREAARKRLAEARKAMASRAQASSSANKVAIADSVGVLKQLPHQQSDSEAFLPGSEHLSLSSTFDAMSCSMAVVPNSQEVKVTNVSSTPSNLVH